MKTVIEMWHKAWPDPGTFVRASAQDLERFAELVRADEREAMRERLEQPAQQHSDDVAVDRFAGAMKAKMAKQQVKGYGGWDDPAACPTERLQQMLVAHISKGDPLDVANFAMMLWNRGERTEQPAQQQEPPDGYVVVARAVLKKLGIDDDVIDTIAGRSTPQPAQPEHQKGWKLVPVEPTHRMLSEGSCAQSLPGPHYISESAAKQCWSYMLKAAPPAQRKPLTDEQRQYVVQMWRGGNWTAGDIIDAVEAAHGIKGDA